MKAWEASIVVMRTPYGWGYTLWIDDARSKWENHDQYTTKQGALAAARRVMTRLGLAEKKT